MIIDYYPKVQNKPMICVIQLDEARLMEKNERIKPPQYLCIEKEITDMPEFQPKQLAIQTKKDN